MPVSGTTTYRASCDFPKCKWSTEHEGKGAKRRAEKDLSFHLELHKLQPQDRVRLVNALPRNIHSPEWRNGDLGTLTRVILDQDRWFVTLDRTKKCQTCERPGLPICVQVKYQNIEKI